MLHFDDMVAYRVEHDIGNAMQAQLPHDIESVGLDGLQAQIQGISDLLVRITFCQELQHLPFSRSKPVLPQPV